MVCSIAKSSLCTSIYYISRNVSGAFYYERSREFDEGASFLIMSNIPSETTKIALQFNGIHETIRSVMAGYGANFISSLAVREYVESGQLARVYVKDIHAIKHKIAICTRNNEKQNLLVQRFIETIKNSPI